jgi:hypothetical protein
MCALFFSIFCAHPMKRKNDCADTKISKKQCIQSLENNKNETNENPVMESIIDHKNKHILSVHYSLLESRRTGICPYNKKYDQST